MDNAKAVYGALKMSIPFEDAFEGWFSEKIEFAWEYADRTMEDVEDNFDIASFCENLFDNDFIAVDADNGVYVFRRID